MGIEQQYVISDNAHSAHGGDCLAYDLYPSCLMLPHPQEFSIPLRNIDILIFVITFKKNDIQPRVQLSKHWATASPIKSPNDEN